EGGPCEGHDWEGADVECAVGLRCARETATCVRREVASLGEACLGPVECAPGLRCASGVCVDRLCDGAPCGRSYGSLCTEPDACEPSLDCNDGVCARTATPGERCAPPDVCSAGAECVDGVCVRFPGLGESCRDRCARGLCSGGRCVTLAEGEACEASAFLDACADGLICDGTCIPRPQLGEACSFEPATCELGAVCNTENVCEALCRLGPEP
ncbi:MAG: hypothetical protein J0L92_40845, partial [Deltaproteobacteria bacterium]|nr:hypothetical protein [Deltaproteobacteria bacterium]